MIRNKREVFTMTLFEELELLLVKDERFVSEGKLLKNKIVESALKLDKDLIKLLLNSEKIKAHFFIEVDKTLVFDKEKFMKFIDNKEFLPDSYTSFKNKIGLTTDDGRYISKSREVVLAWPYKDCVLEGGQKKEDEKREEIFYNEILAPDEIDRLLEPKVLTNFKRIDVKGEHTLDGFKRDAEVNKKRGLPKDTITDNLIIKGNNLLVLHSLLKEFRGKVKLIYIDPPYNTGNDSFNYNDNFNHSTWLTFMKNRLEIARDLLREDGVIFVQCDDNEQAYLKVLMDEIFNRSNFVSNIVVRSSTPSGTKTAHKEKTIIKQHDSILVFAKDKSNINFRPQYSKSKSWDSHYSIYIEKIDDRVQLLKLEDVLREKGILNESEKLKEINIDNKKFKDFYLKNAEKIARWTSHENKEIIKLCLSTYKDKLYITKDNKGKETIYLNKQVLQQLSYSIKEVYDNKKITKDIANLVCDFWDDIDFQNTQNEGVVSLPAGKKPEFLLYRIINMTTDSGEIILDFFMGTGTTCAVAHKMGRQYIGVEQLDYGENSAVVRLKNVIGKENSKGKLISTIKNYDTTGISKAVNWQGGGDFIYCELKELNEEFIQKIEDTKNSEEILKIWEDMKKQAFLSYRVDSKLFDDNIEEFKELPIEEQKELLIKCLDANDLYVNYSEIKDSQYNISDKDIKLNNEFYRGL